MAGSIVNRIHGFGCLEFRVFRVLDCADAGVTGFRGLAQKSLPLSTEATQSNH